MIFTAILYLILFSFVVLIGFIISLYIYYKGVLPIYTSKIVDTTTGKYPYIANIKPSFPFGEFVNIVKDPWAFMDSTMTGVGLKFYWVFTEPTITITEPEIAKSVLSNKESTYHRDFSRTPFLLKRLEGTGIIAVDGDEWSRQHRLLSRAFGIKTIRSFNHPMHSICKDIFFSELDKEISQNNKSINLLPMVQQLAMSLATVIALGGSKDISNRVTTLLFFLIDHFGDPLYLIPGWINVPTPLNRKVRATYEELDNLIYQLIAERREATKGLSEEERKGLQTVLDILIDSKDQDGSTFTNTEIRDNILTFFLAGSETTATVFIWFLIHSALHSDVKKKLLEEVDTVLGGREFQPDDIKSLPYFTAVLNETMRFTPPLYGGIPRVTKKEEKVGDWIVPAGISLSVNNTAVAHNEKYWKDPHVFNPERFLEPEPKHTYSFIPFGAGSRSCIGKHFALQELYVVLTSFLQTYDYKQTSPNYEIGKRPNVILEIPFMHPKKGTTMFEVTKRKL